MKFFYFSLLLVCMQCFAGAPPVDKCPEKGAYISQFLKEGDVGIEFEVNNGALAYNSLLKKAPAKLYLIDPWIYYPQLGTDVNLIPNRQRARDQQYEEVRNTFESFDNVEIIRVRPEEVAHLFQDNFLDYVYIGVDPLYDAVTRYETVTRDLENYFSKVKEGGYIFGEGFAWQGVNPAVKEFLERHSEECEFVNDPIYGDSAGQFVIRKGSSKSWWRFW